MTSLSTTAHRRHQVVLALRKSNLKLRAMITAGLLTVVLMIDHVEIKNETAFYVEALAWFGLAYFVFFFSAAKFDRKHRKIKPNSKSPENSSAEKCV